MAFCPKCGITINQNQKFCDEHRPINIDVKPFNIVMCNCGRFFAHNHWFYPNDVNDSILKVAREHIKQKVSLVINEFEIPEKRGRKNKGVITATFEGEDYPINFFAKHSRCEKCAKMGSHYFTAILQLRDIPSEVLPFIEEFLKPLAEKGISVNNVEDTPRGPDLYLSHKTTARQLGEKLVRKFGGVFKQSEQLFSRNHQTSKNLYRLNVVVQFPLFKRNDIIIINNKVVLVTGLGKQCTGRNLSLNKKVIFVAGEEDFILKKHKTTITTIYPEIAVIHPETFQAVAISNLSSAIGDVENGQNVKVVVFKEEVFIV